MAVIPTQDGCAFQVTDVEALFAEFKAHGLDKELSAFDIERREDGSSWKVFYVVAPDGLCYRSASGSERVRDEMTSPRQATEAVWAGEDESLLTGATVVPISLGGPRLPRRRRWLDVALGNAPGHIYRRNTNPTVAAFEEKVRPLEGADAATSFATGMAAISNTLFTLLAPGDRIVSVKDTYGGTTKLFTEFLPRIG